MLRKVAWSRGASASRSHTPSWPTLSLTAVTSVGLPVAVSMSDLQTSNLGSRMWKRCPLIPSGDIRNSHCVSVSLLPRVAPECERHTWLRICQCVCECRVWMGLCPSVISYICICKQLNRPRFPSPLRPGKDLCGPWVSFPAGIRAPSGREGRVLEADVPWV